MSSSIKWYFHLDEANNGQVERRKGETNALYAADHALILQIDDGGGAIVETVPFRQFIGPLNSEQVDRYDLRSKFVLIPT